MSNLSHKDRDILRRLAERKMRMAEDPVNLERREAWYALDDGATHRPMVLVEAFDVRDAFRPWDIVGELQCTDPWARRLEQWVFGKEWYEFNILKDDRVVEPYLTTNWQVTASDYGVQKTIHRTDNGGQMTTIYYRRR